MKRTVITVGLVLLFVTGLCGCGWNRELTQKTTDIEVKTVELSDSNEPTQLMALADTQEAAQEIADLYGIELNSFSNGVATYTTDKNLQELLELGQENGYPELSPDYENKLYTVQ